MGIPELVGRSSSHFTRTARIFALELDVAHTFRPVVDIKSIDPACYAGNPTLKLPILVDEEGPLFGTENICRALVRRSARADVVMRGDVATRIVANAEELTLHVMATDVAIIIGKMIDADRPTSPKLVHSLEGSLDHLDANVDAVVAALPPARSFSFVEVALFCAVTHLPFRETLDVSRWGRLAAFCDAFGSRESAKASTYRFDAV